MIYLNPAKTNIVSAAKRTANAITSTTSTAMTKSANATKATFAAISEKAQASANFVKNHKLATIATVLSATALVGALYFQNEIADFCNINANSETNPSSKTASKGCVPGLPCAVASLFLYFASFIGVVR